ncbi:MAG: NYN domain-containing protein [Dermatophilus congolensis]|nr:NYN domain-containing protein [Dermatophilus congolensis]
MRSCSALYIDAGYLLASAATRVCGTSLRASVQVDHEKLIQGLIEQVEKESGLPLMRANWYDSGNGSGGQPDATQAHLGMMPRVKLRLGRRSYSGEQKGVDLRLGLDLVTQARNRAIDIAYLLSGDDDLTEAVEEAQDHGVQVIVFAVPTAQDAAHAVAKHLQMEADGLSLIDGAIIDSTVTRLPRTAEAQLRSDSAAVAAMRAIATANVGTGVTGGPDSSTADPEDASPATAGPVGGQPGSSTTEEGAAVAEAAGQAASTQGVAAVHSGDAASSTAEAPAHPTPAMLGRKRVTAPANGTHPPTQRTEPRPDDSHELVYSTTVSDRGVVVTDRYSGRLHGDGDAPESLVDADAASIDAVCRSVLSVWLENATDGERAALEENRPSIPSDVDRALLRDLSMRINVYEIAEQDRHALRARFWHVADEVMAAK